MATPIATATAADEVTLHVGDRTFHTTKTVLEGSRYLAAMMDDRFTSNSRRPDGSYFLDLDGDIFEHILIYLRCSQMPLLWTAEQGFDIFKYHKILLQADYLNLKDMVTWIEKKKFETVVKQDHKIVIRLIATDGEREYPERVLDIGSNDSVIDRYSSTIISYSCKKCQKAKEYPYSRYASRPAPRCACGGQWEVMHERPCVEFVIEKREVDIKYKKLLPKATTTSR